MSDLQLATGISILISGYVQLSCRLSLYHWGIIGRLAWFSSLTHLSCLTLLRSYLHKNKPERQWRLFFMFVLVIMLVTAMASTKGNGLEPPSPDYAICSFSIDSVSGSLDSILSMVLLACLIVFGFLFRVIKLYRPLSSSVRDSKQRIRQGTYRLLHTIYDSRSHSRRRRKLARCICYYFLLAWILSMHLLVDHFTSMFFEVRYIY